MKLQGVGRVILLVSCWALALGGVSLPRGSSAALKTPIPDWVKEKLSNPLTERDCVDLALEFSYAVQRSKLDVDRAGAGRLSSLSAFLPSMSVASGFQRRVTGPTDFSFFDPNSGRLISGLTEEKTDDSWYLDFTVRQTLFNLADLEDLRQAQRLLTGSRLSYQNWKLEVEYNVVSQFYLLLKAMKLAEVAEESLKLSEEQLRKAENLKDQGAGTHADVLKAKVRVSESNLDLISARNRVDVERAKLLSVMGLPWMEEVRISDELQVDLSEPDSAALWKSALENRPDLRQAGFLLAAAEAARASAKARRWPSLNGTFRYSWTGRHVPDARSVMDKDYSWFVGAAVSMPLFDGLYTKSRINTASADLMKRRVDYAELKQQVALELKQALLSYREARQRFVAAREGVDAAEEDYRLSREKFQLGSGTMLELIAAEVSRTKAMSSLIEAQSDLKTAEAKLNRVAGIPIGAGGRVDRGF